MNIFFRVKRMPIIVTEFIVGLISLLFVMFIIGGDPNSFFGVNMQPEDLIHWNFITALSSVSMCISALISTLEDFFRSSVNTFFHKTLMVWSFSNELVFSSLWILMLCSVAYYSGALEQPQNLVPSLFVLIMTAILLLKCRYH